MQIMGLFSPPSWITARQRMGQQVGIMLDFEKAYDRVNPDYLASSPSSRWGSLPPSSRSSTPSSLRPGYTSTSMATLLPASLKDVDYRQGDPLSPLLFNIALEPLLQTIMNRPDLNGISSLTAIKIVLMAYADDVLLFLNNKQEWQRIQVILKLYEAASNGESTINKTTAFPLTLQPDQDLKTDLLSNSVQWHDSDSPAHSSILDTQFPICQAHINKYLDDLLSKIQKSINIHSQRTLSVLGKAVIVNSLILSRLWHAFGSYHLQSLGSKKSSVIVKPLSCPTSLPHPGSLVLLPQGVGWTWYH